VSEQYDSAQAEETVTTDTPEDASAEETLDAAVAVEDLAFGKLVFAVFGGNSQQ